MEYTIEADGAVIDEKRLNMELAPHESKQIPIFTPKQEYHYGLYLTSRLYHSGELVAACQHKLGDGKMPAGEMIAAATDDKVYEVIFSGKEFRYVFSKQFGAFTSLVIDGKEQIAEPVRLTAWRRPPTMTAISSCSGAATIAGREKISTSCSPKCITVKSPRAASEWRVPWREFPGNPSSITHWKCL